MKNILKQLAIFLVGCTVILQLGANITPAFAQAPAPTEFKVGTYLKTQDQKDVKLNISSYIVRLINFLTMSIGSFSFLALVVGGIIMITSAGSEASLTKGKDIIKYALIGLAIALMAFYITMFVQSIFFEYDK